MPLSTKLDSTLRAAEDDSDDEEYYEVTDRSSPSILDTGDGAEIVSSGSEAEDNNSDHSGNVSDDSNGEHFQDQLSNVSFGALAKAQDAIATQHGGSRKRKRGEEASASQQDKLQALRERLQQIKAQKSAIDQPRKKNKTADKKQKSRGDEPGSDEDSPKDNSDEDSDGAPHARSSKHAPAVQSSKRAVTRRRNVFESQKKPSFRDPRFDNMGGARPDDNTMKKRYGFLDEYRADEMGELRKAIKQSKNEDDKESLKRKLLSMESQKKARDAKEKQQEITREHKKKEKEAIKEGKKPFYLKKSEQKKLALIDRFQNMKSKDRDRAIERRRKKLAAKERRNMPFERRSA